MELFFISTSSIILTLLLLCLTACLCCRKNCFLPVCRAVCKCLCQPWSFFRQKTRTNNTLNILPSNNIALRPMAGTSKRLKRRAPSPPTNLFRSLLPPKDSEPNIIVNTKLSPSTSRRFLNYIQTEPQPTRRLRSQDRRFQEL